MSDISKKMAEYLENTGKPSLRGFVSDHKSSIDSYIAQFDKPVEATKNLQLKFKTAFKNKCPKRKRGPDVKLDIEEAWMETRTRRTANIETGRVSNALLTAGGKKATRLLKNRIHSHEPAHSTEPVQSHEPVHSHEPAHSPKPIHSLNHQTRMILFHQLQRTSNDSSNEGGCHNPNIINDNVASNSNVEEEPTEGLVFILDEEHGFKSSISINDDTPDCYKHFKEFQKESFELAQKKGLFVNTDLFSTLSLYNIVLLKKNHPYPQIDFTPVNDELLQDFESCPNIDNSIFVELVQIFRGDIGDRDEVKILLFDLYKKATKPDRRIIDILINLVNKLPNEEITAHVIEEQELIVNYTDPVFSPLLHDPGHDKLFIWLNRTVLDNYDKLPDAGCVESKGKRLGRYFGFAEIKPEYKKKDAVKTHEDLLRLSLFGLNALEEHDSKSVFLMQVIGSIVNVYGCFDRDDGAVVVVELKEFKMPMSLKDLPGFIMSLDNLKKIDHFYRLHCFNNKGKRKRRPSTSISLDEIVNRHTPKNKKTTIDF